jgi:hypothetical protein
MHFVVIMVLLAFGTTAHAQATFLSYDQWERLPTGLQVIYVAGVVDGLSTVSTRESSGTAKYCGGLISFVPDEIDQFGRTAGYVDRILNGEKPGDLPVQAPTRHETVPNPVFRYQIIRA